MKRIRLLVAALVLTSPLAANADPIGMVQTFDGDVNISGGTVNGWFGELVPDAGQSGSGDNALRYDSGGMGFHLLTWFGREFPDEAFLGNFLDAGVVGVQFDALHEGGADLFLRAFIFGDSFGGTYSSTGAEILADANEWATYTIWFDIGDLILFPGNTDPNQSSADILSDVWQFGLRHDPGGDGPMTPDLVDATVLFDNLRLVTVPEPGTLALLGIGLAGMGLARRKKKV